MLPSTGRLRIQVVKYVAGVLSAGAAGPVIRMRMLHSPATVRRLLLDVKATVHQACHDWHKHNARLLWMVTMQGAVATLADCDIAAAAFHTIVGTGACYDHCC